MVAPCAMGLESVVSQELKFLQMQAVRAEDRRVFFEGDMSGMARANINLRAADRVLIVLGRFAAKTFDELFESVKALPLEDFVGSKDAFPVKGASLQSALHSVPDCQAIIKKAVASRLGAVYKQEWFQESGPVKQLQFLILKDEVTLMLDTSGENLHKRGYRPLANDAPIKETLAAGILSLAKLWNKKALLDPMCGSGTFLIEGALMARKIAPGIRRSFAAESFDCAFDGCGKLAELFSAERERARGFEKNDADFRAFGWDNDPAAVELTRRNAHRAGVQDSVHAELGELSAFSSGYENACVVTNPPYGERLLDVQQAQAIYKLLGKVLPKGGVSVITPDKDFEKLFGRKADKRRKLYNGKIQCQLYMYF